MIRSCRIPPILNRICNGDGVLSAAMLVTADGELLGSTCSTFVSPATGEKESMESLGTLIADIAVDYQRLGEEYMHIEETGAPGGTQQQPPKKSHLQALILELDQGLVGVSSCAGIDCLVIGLAPVDAPQGMIKAKLQAMAEHVQEALSPLAAETSSTYR